jgi:hypothetical protein
MNAYVIPCSDASGLCPISPDGSNMTVPTGSVGVTGQFLPDSTNSLRVNADSNTTLHVGDQVISYVADPNNPGHYIAIVGAGTVQTTAITQNTDTVVSAGVVPFASIWAS